MLKYYVVISHRQGRDTLNEITEREINLIDRIMALQDPSVVLVGTEKDTKKDTLKECLAETVDTDATHIPDTNIGKITKPTTQFNNAISCPLGERPAEQLQCVAMPCQFPNCNCIPS